MCATAVLLQCQPNYSAIGFGCHIAEFARCSSVAQETWVCIACGADFVASCSCFTEWAPIITCDAFFIGARGDRVFVFTEHDLRADAASCFQRIGTFLKLPHDDTWVHDVAQCCSLNPSS